MVILTNAFSISMLPADATLSFRRISLAEARELVASEPVRNVIGHPTTDALVREMLGGDLPEGVRESIVFNPSDMLLVAQYIGPRLPEGATVLPEGARIEFYLVTYVV